MSLCNQFALSSTSIKHWFSRQPEVKEESITDWLLDDLSSKESTVIYKQFSRYDESHLSGADWEWWFILSSNKFFSAVVQAKKLVPKKDNYDGIMHKPKTTISRPKTELQIKTLRTFAKQNSFAALYAFYSLEDNIKCPIIKNTEGVFIIPADDIHRLFVRTRKRKILPERIIRESLPLSCMLCCPLIKRTTGITKNLPKAFEDFLYKKFIKQTNPLTDNSNSPSPVGFKNQLPAYVGQIIRESAGQTGDILVNTDEVTPICKKVLVTDLRAIY